MSAFSQVVVGLDGSQSALNALLWAADRVPDASGIHVVHAGAPDPVLPGEVRFGTIHCRDETPADALMLVASEVNADAIVVGPHGSGFGRGVGSATKQLLRASTIPIIVVDDRELPRSAHLAPPVVACVGYGEPASAAACWAADFAMERSLPLVLLHSVAYRPIFPLDSASDALASYLGTGVSMSWALDEIGAMAAELQESRPTLAITTHIESSSVIKAVRHAGETAELVVLGKRDEEEFLHAIGTPRLRRLVSRSRFPTAVVPAGSCSGDR